MSSNRSSLTHSPSTLSTLSGSPNAETPASSREAGDLEDQLRRDIRNILELKLQDFYESVGLRAADTSRICWPGFCFTGQVKIGKTKLSTWSSNVSRSRTYLRFRTWPGGDQFKYHVLLVGAIGAGAVQTLQGLRLWNLGDHLTSVGFGCC